ncbi:MAG: hypothetical protein IPM36_09455 [Lewinellaceae bacterium]|nr:hypothetical protein [Lewinellaceae bacterium]
MEIDKSVFLEKFVLYNLQEFFTKVEANADTKEKIAVSILQFIDLELTLEFYLNPKYSSGDYSIIEDEIDEHEVEEGDYLKRTGVNLESGEVRESKWGEEFNFYKNLFKFLRFFQMYKITECPNPGDIIRFCDESIIYSQMKIGTGREGFGNPFYDNYDNSVNVSVNLNKSIKNLNDFVKSTGLDKELLAIYDDAKNKYDEIMLEIKSGIDLNNNLVMELLS